MGKFDSSASRKIPEALAKQKENRARANVLDKHNPIRIDYQRSARQMHGSVTSRQVTLVLFYGHRAMKPKLSVQPSFYVAQ